jgi:ADP-dependent NAD(P)H-hydrate dehydratase / NAD(P)H-hydrate epimerase
MYLVTADEMREMDNRTITEFGLPGRLLMENAGRGATDFFLEFFDRWSRLRVAVIAGKGNNGGDGFVMARYLADKGIKVTVFLLALTKDVKGDAKANLALLEKLNVPVVEIPDKASFSDEKDHLHQHNIYLDAILGTGLRSEIKGFFKDIISFINQTKAPVFCVDIPSGINSDTGQPCGISIQGRATATFAFPKIGHVTHPGADYTGKLKVVDIGIPAMIAEAVAPKQQLVTQEIAKKGLIPRKADAHKGTTGHVMVIAGSTGKTGAAAMTATAALRTGAGLVTLGVPETLNPILESQLLEAMTLPLPDGGQGQLEMSAFQPIVDSLSGKKCLAIGPGLGTAPGTKELIWQLIAQSTMPVVIDADGLNCMAKDIDKIKGLKVPVIITPHPGEMARLIDVSPRDIQEDRIACARKFAMTYGVYVVLKGAGTILTDPEGKTLVNMTGNSGMASGGMGDVLTGMIAALIAQGASASDAAICAVYLHGAAADSLFEEFGPCGYLAGDLLDVIPEQMKALSL